MNREIVCISCPVGCRMTVSTGSNEKEITVEGNRCQRGYEYGLQEALAPTRLVTATVALASKTLPRLPVKTTIPLGRERISELLDALYAIRLTPPVAVGDSVLDDFAGTGVDVVATRSVEEEPHASSN